jgi:hypothetical protein
VLRWAKTKTEEKTIINNKEAALGNSWFLGLFFFISFAP